MNIFESGEDYLEMILILSKKQENIRSIDIVNEMNFSKPSVSIAMKKLKESDYIHIDLNGFISLTDTGKEIANKVYERHVILTRMLTQLGVDEKTAKKDACKIEHDLSDESFEAIKKSLK